jgi:methyltransferase
MVVAVGAAVFSAMLVEAHRAARNEHAQRLRGGLEPPGDVYTVMRIAYPGAFLAMLGEGMLRGGFGVRFFAAGAAVFASAKALKWWAIAALGPSWTFRVIVVPGMRLVESGPYRWVRHPNYIAVMGELLGVGLMAGAAITATLSSLLFAGLLAKRISVESRMLTAARRPSLTSNIPGGTIGHNEDPSVPRLHADAAGRTGPRKRSGNV